MKTFQLLSFFLFSCLIAKPQLEASHVQGGYIYSEVLSVNTGSSRVRFNVTLYRDRLSGGANFDMDPFFGVYAIDDNTGEYVITNQIVGVLGPIETVVNESGVILDSGTYQFSLDLDHGSDYLISYQRCCRSDLLTNVETDIGIAIQVELMAEALLEVGASPILGSVPITVVNVGTSFQDALNFISNPLHEISVSFVAPLQSGGVGGSPPGCCNCVQPFPAQCGPPYNQINFFGIASASNPFGADNNVILDTITRGLSGRMQIIGLYQYGILITTEQNGILLSRQILDYGLYSVLSSSVDEANSELTTLYPNPHQGRLFLDQLHFEPTQYEVFSLSGTLVSKGKLAHPYLDLELTPGTYYIRFINTQKGEEAIIQTVKI